MYRDELNLNDDPNNYIGSTGGGLRLNSRDEKAIAMHNAGASLQGISRGLGIPPMRLFEVLGLSKEDHPDEFAEIEFAQKRSGIDNPITSRRHQFERVNDGAANPYFHGRSS